MAAARASKLLVEQKDIPLKRVIGVSENELSDDNPTIALCEYYVRHVTHAAIAATIAPIHTFKGVQNKFSNFDSIYVRDQAVILDDLRLIIYSLDPGDHHSSMLDALKYLNYTAVNINADCIDDSFGILDGGNSFYYAPKKIFLYGCISRDRRRHEDTIDRLKNVLTPFNITVIPIDSSLHENPIVDISYYFYYHLDCFMQVLPDGRVLLLNSKIITPDSLAALHKYFGKENVFDLQYSDYNKEEYVLLLNDRDLTIEKFDRLKYSDDEKDLPEIIKLLKNKDKLTQELALAKPNYMFNFLCGEDGPNYTLLCTTTPQEIISKLRDLNFTVITPAAFDSDSLRYGSEEFDISVATRMVDSLENLGYRGLNVAKLTHQIPYNEKGYGLKSSSYFYKAFTETEINFENFVSETFQQHSSFLDQLEMNMTLQSYKFSFCPSNGAHHSGGIHCTTLELPFAPKQAERDSSRSLDDKTSPHTTMMAKLISEEPDAVITSTPSGLVKNGIFGANSLEFKEIESLGESKSYGLK